MKSFFRMLWGIIGGMLATALRIIAVIYVAVALFLYVFQRTLIYPAPADLRSPQDVGMPAFVEVEAESDGRRLTSWFVAPSQPGHPVLVFFHGNAASQAMAAPWMKPYIEAGYGVLLVAWRGYNGDGGQPTETGLYADSRAALGSLKQLGYGPERVVLIGQSLGTGIAIEMASEGYGRALVLEAPYTRIADVAALHYPFLPVRWLLKDHYDNLAKIGAVNVPVFIISGALDVVVPQALSRQLYETALPPKDALWLDKAGHNDLYDHGAQEAIIEFLAKELTNEPHPR